MSDKWKVFGVMLGAVILAAVGEALAAKGMKAAQQEPMPLLRQIQAALSDWHVMAGFLAMVGYVLLYIYALGKADLSFALPLSASSYLLGLGFSKWYLGEEIKPARLIGTLVIIVGVLIVGVLGQSGGKK
jgi:drug/metabolite transporter (DMT)-like permease